MADSDGDEPAATGSTSDEQLLAQAKLVPMKLELAWQETDRLEGLLHKWGGAGAGVATARAAMAEDLATAFKNIDRLVDGSKKGGQSAKPVSLRDEPDAASALDNGAAEPNDFDMKRSKRLVKKLRAACKAAKPLKLPRVADPWGDEVPSWRAKFIEERGTAIMVVLDGLQLYGNDMLRAQRKAIYRLLEMLSKAAAEWARAAEASAAAPPAAAEAAAATAAPAPAAAATPTPTDVGAPAPARVAEKAATGVNAAEPATDDPPASAGAQIEEHPTPTPTTVDGWTTVRSKKARRKAKR